MVKRLFPLLALLLLPSCGGEPSLSATSVQSASADLPKGATVGPEGHATIRDAPPAPFRPVDPGDPPPLTPEQVKGHERFRRAGLFQNEEMERVQALAERLRAAENGNFVDLYFENEGQPHVVFRFLRNPEATLARYSREPRFRAALAQYSTAELQRAADFMLAEFREERVVQSVGVGNKRNRVEVEISVTEPEFWALVARKGVEIPDSVELHFRAEAPAAEVNRPLPPRIARLVRAFPRHDRPHGMLHSINSHARVVLEDGCFRVSGGEQDGALVLFPLGASLFIDRENYLAYGGEEVPGYARVGEELVFPGTIGEVTAAELVAPLRKACGPGRVVAITALRSAAAERAQQSVAQNARALRQLREDYGLSEPQAQHALESCKRRSGFGTCLLTPPPPPGGLSCPPGTRPSYGLCRTPEGHVRPLPGWIRELIGAN